MIGDLDDLLLDPLYEALGATVDIIRPVQGTEPETVMEGARVIDKTAGVETSGSSDINVHTISPVMAMRAKDLVAAGLEPVALVGCHVTLNGVNWRIQNHVPKPGFQGEQRGQVYFTMRKAPSNG